MQYFAGIFVVKLLKLRKFNLPINSGNPQFIKIMDVTNSSGATFHDFGTSFMEIVGFLVGFALHGRSQCCQCGQTF